MKGNIIQDMIEQALLQTHTAFCARVISTSGDLAAIQPLHMVKAIGGQPQMQAVIPDCPVLQSAVKFTSLNPAAARKVQAGDTVYCVCAERDISETRSGTAAVPVIGRHMLSSAVVVGIL